MGSMHKTEHQHAPLHGFLSILRTLQEIDKDFPLHYALCLGEIAASPGLSLTDLSKRTGLNLSTISRIVGALSNYRPNGAPYQFVTMQVNAQERRRKELYLTQAGEAVIARIDTYMRGIFQA